jgi:hypothetical protein
MGKILNYYLPLNISESVQRTLNFFNSQSGYSIRDSSGDPMGSYWRVVINHGFSFMSWGEDYILEFRPSFNESWPTQVIATISLNFGYGLQWSVPNGVMHNWAMYVNTVPQELMSPAGVIVLVVVIIAIILIPMMIALFPLYQ